MSTRAAGSSSTTGMRPNQNEVREVVIAGVPGVGGEGEGELGAGLDREALEGGGEGEADEAGGVVRLRVWANLDWSLGLAGGRARGDRAEDGVERRRLGEEPDRPGAEVFVGIIEAGRAGRAYFCPSVECPEGAEAVGWCPDSFG